MASSSNAPNLFADRVFFNRAQILNLKGRNVEVTDAIFFNKNFNGNC